MGEKQSPSNCLTKSLSSSAHFSTSSVASILRSRTILLLFFKMSDLTIFDSKSLIHLFNTSYILDKNILKLGDHPLIAYSIAAARISTSINRVIVSTDSEKYGEIAKRYGAEVPFLRPKSYAEDTSVDRDFLLHAINWFKVNEKISPEFFVHLRPTTPLREPEVINQAIKAFLANEEATSLRSAHLAPESPMKWFTKDDIYFKGFVDKELSNLPKESFKIL